ncbi:hypothetical protein [Streptomyces sp. FL06-04B]|uniref:hypothetical protein n=1 Tax=Streptomyces sp. FL06-04B TaxID=3028657 RepID=UPI0039F54ECD
MALAGLRRSPVRGPEGDHGGGDHRRDDRGRHDPGAQAVAAGRLVLGVERISAPVEARARGPGTVGLGHRDVHGGAGGLHEGQGGDRSQDGSGPGARRVGAFGGAAAAGAVVDMPDELAAQGGGEQHLVVAGEPGDGGAVATLDDGEGGAGALHLAGRGGQQLPGGGGLKPEHGGDGARGEAVAYGQFEGFALLRGGARGLGPGECGELPAAGLGGR